MPDDPADHLLKANQAVMMSARDIAAFLQFRAVVRVRASGVLGVTFHMEGHWDADGRQMAAAIARVLGAPAVPIRPLPWWQLRLAALASPARSGALFAEGR